MAASPQTAYFSDILIAIRDRISVALDLDPSRVKLAANDRYQVNDLDQVTVYVRPYAAPLFANAGAGRRAMPTRRMVRVYYYVRNSSDLPGDDTIGITDPTYGLLQVEEKLLDYLVLWYPQTNTEARLNLTIEPLHPLDPSGGPPERELENDIGMLRGSLLFEVCYLPKLDNVLP